MSWPSGHCHTDVGDGQTPVGIIRGICIDTTPMSVYLSGAAVRPCLWWGGVTNIWGPWSAESALLPKPLNVGTRPPPSPAASLLDAGMTLRQ